MKITAQMLLAKRKECLDAIRQHNELAAANAGALQVIEELLGALAAPPENGQEET